MRVGAPGVAGTMPLGITCSRAGGNDRGNFRRDCPAHGDDVAAASTKRAPPLREHRPHRGRFRGVRDAARVFASPAGIARRAGAVETGRAGRICQLRAIKADRPVVTHRDDIGRVARRSC